MQVMEVDRRSYLSDLRSYPNPNPATDFWQAQPTFINRILTYAVQKRSPACTMMIVSDRTAKSRRGVYAKTKPNLA
jgi:hypothetical protein